MSTNWDFGDGATSTEAETTHTYADPGTYTVTVTAMDANGNMASTTRQIEITPAEVPPGTTTTTTTTTTDVLPTPTGDAPATDLPTTPTLDAPKAKVELRLKGRTLTITAALKLKRGARCSGTGRATTRVSGKRYAAKLRLTGTAKACVASGRITLKKAPTAKAKIVVRVTASEGQRRRLLTAAR